VSWLLDAHNATKWAVARGEQVVLSGPRGPNFLVGLFGWAIELDLAWGESTVQVTTPLPREIPESEQAERCRRLLALNRETLARGVAFDFAGRFGISIRAVIPLVAGRVSSDDLASAVDAVRDVLLAHAVEVSGVATFTDERPSLRAVDVSGFGIPAAGIRADVASIRNKVAALRGTDLIVSGRRARIVAPMARIDDVVRAAELCGGLTVSSIWSNAEISCVETGIYLDENGTCSLAALQTVLAELENDRRWLAEMLARPAAPPPATLTEVLPPGLRIWGQNRAEGRAGHIMATNTTTGAHSSYFDGMRTLADDPALSEPIDFDFVLPADKALLTAFDSAVQAARVREAALTDPMVDAVPEAVPASADGCADLVERLWLIGVLDGSEAATLRGATSEVVAEHLRKRQ
jgi:hypothetical protein